MNIPSADSGDVRPVLALLGDRYHNVDYLRINFNRLFAELGLAYEYTSNYEWFGDEEQTTRLLAGRKLLILGRDGMIWPSGYVGPEAYGHYITSLMNDAPNGSPETWVTEGFGKAVSAWVEGGGSIFVWHNALHVSLYSQAFRELSGGAYDGHPAERPWKVEVVNRDHPITAGVEDFIVTDEQHFPLYDRTDADVLLRGINVDGLTFDSDSGAIKGGTQSVTAWAHTVGEGRVVMSAVGHNLDALWKPSYWTFQKNAVRWLLGEL